MADITGPDRKSPDKTVDKSAHQNLTSVMDRLRLHQLPQSLSQSVKTMNTHNGATSLDNYWVQMEQLLRKLTVSGVGSIWHQLDSVAFSLGLECVVDDSSHISLRADVYTMDVGVDGRGRAVSVRLSHSSGDTMNSEELLKLINANKFEEVKLHLESLKAVYNVAPDKKQRMQAFKCLLALETDLTKLSQLSSSVNSVLNVIHKTPLGLLLPREGGLPMRLVFFVSPYDILDKTTGIVKTVTQENISEALRGGGACEVTLEPASQCIRLQRMPLMSVSKSADNQRPLPSFSNITATNSCQLEACFYLRLLHPMVLTKATLKTIGSITDIPVLDDTTPLESLLKLLQQSVQTESTDTPQQWTVRLPGQRHQYLFATPGGEDDSTGVLVSAIPFTHPTHVVKIVQLLRQQAAFNAVISSCMRKAKDSGAKIKGVDQLVFEVSVLSLNSIFVSFEHPYSDTIATAEIDLTDVSSPVCNIVSLQTDGKDSTAINTEAATKIFQKCFSVPVTFHAIIAAVSVHLEQCIPTPPPAPPPARPMPIPQRPRPPPPELPRPVSVLPSPVLVTNGLQPGAHAAMGLVQQVMSQQKSWQEELKAKSLDRNPMLAKLLDQDQHSPPPCEPVKPVCHTPMLSSLLEDPAPAPPPYSRAVALAPPPAAAAPPPQQPAAKKPRKRKSEGLQSPPVAKRLAEEDAFGHIPNRFQTLGPDIHPSDFHQPPPFLHHPGAGAPPPSYASRGPNFQCGTRVGGVVSAPPHLSSSMLSNPISSLSNSVPPSTYGSVGNSVPPSTYGSVGNSVPPAAYGAYPLIDVSPTAGGSVMSSPVHSYNNVMLPNGGAMIPNHLSGAALAGSAPGPAIPIVHSAIQPSKPAGAQHHASPSPQLSSLGVMLSSPPFTTSQYAHADDPFKGTESVISQLENSLESFINDRVFPSVVAVNDRGAFATTAELPPADVSAFQDIPEKVINQFQYQTNVVKPRKSELISLLAEDDDDCPDSSSQSGSSYFHPHGVDGQCDVNVKGGAHLCDDDDPLLSGDLSSQMSSQKPKAELPGVKAEPGLVKTESSAVKAEPVVVKSEPGAAQCGEMNDGAANVDLFKLLLVDAKDGKITQENNREGRTDATRDVKPSRALEVSRRKVPPDDCSDGMKDRPMGITVKINLNAKDNKTIVKHTPLPPPLDRGKRPALYNKRPPPTAALASESPPSVSSDSDDATYRPPGAYAPRSSGKRGKRKRQHRSDSGSKHERKRAAREGKDEEVLKKEQLVKKQKIYDFEPDEVVVPPTLKPTKIKIRTSELKMTILSPSAAGGGAKATHVVESGAPEAGTVKKKKSRNPHKIKTGGRTDKLQRTPIVKIKPLNEAPSGPSADLSSDGSRRPGSTSPAVTASAACVEPAKRPVMPSPAAPGPDTIRPAKPGSNGSSSSSDVGRSSKLNSASPDTTRNLKLSVPASNPDHVRAAKPSCSPSVGSEPFKFSRQNSGEKRAVENGGRSNSISPVPAEPPARNKSEGKKSQGGANHKAAKVLAAKQRKGSLSAVIEKLSKGRPDTESAPKATSKEMYDQIRLEILKHSSPMVDKMMVMSKIGRIPRPDVKDATVAGGGGPPSANVKATAPATKAGPAGKEKATPLSSNFRIPLNKSEARVNAAVQQRGLDSTAGGGRPEVQTTRVDAPRAENGAPPKAVDSKGDSRGETSGKAEGSKTEPKGLDSVNKTESRNAVDATVVTTSVPPIVPPINRVVGSRFESASSAPCVTRPASPTKPATDLGAECRAKSRDSDGKCKPEDSSDRQQRHFTDAVVEDHEVRPVATSPRGRGPPSLKPVPPPALRVTAATTPPRLSPPQAKYGDVITYYNPVEALGRKPKKEANTSSTIRHETPPASPLCNAPQTPMASSEMVDDDDVFASSSSPPALVVNVPAAMLNPSPSIGGPQGDPLTIPLERCRTQAVERSRSPPPTIARMMDEDDLMNEALTI